MTTSQEGTFRYSNNNVDVRWVQNAHNYRLEDWAVVVNLDVRPVRFAPLDGDSRFRATPKTLLQWESAILRRIEVVEARLLLLIRSTGLQIPDFSNRELGRFPSLDVGALENTLVTNRVMREEVLRGDRWEFAGDLYPDVRGMPLWKTKESLIDMIGPLRFDPTHACRLADEPAAEREMDFMVKCYMWFSFQQSNCGIHNQHEYIEIHTQIAGTGRIPKYSEPDVSKCYEEHRMAPGETLSQAFSLIEPDPQKPGGIRFTYPWHQYYADTDCVWLVAEFHPRARRI